MTSVFDHLVDDRLGTLPGLLTDPEPPLAAAIEAAGGLLVGARPRNVSWIPDRSVTVRYDATVRWSTGEAEEVLVATSADDVPGGLVLQGPVGPLTVWRVPHDPFLPGLAALFDGGRCERLLDDLGCEPGTTSRRIAAYRPGRRAVVRLRRGATSVFVKVVRPDRAERLHRHHVAAESCLPVPRSLGFDAATGLVVLQALPGTTLRSGLTRGVRPGAGALLEVLDLLPLPPERQRSAGWRSSSFGPLLRRLRPDLADRISALEEANRSAEEAFDGPLVPVHGDFHEAQLLVAGRRITGVLDIDTLAVGHRIEDLATMIGHLSTLARSRRDRSAIERYAATLLRSFDAATDPIALRSAVSSVVLGLATGPFRVLHPEWESETERRIELAEEWAGSATRLRGGV